MKGNATAKAVLKVAAVVALLYCFLLSISLMESAFRLSGPPGGAGDVQMRPTHPTGELAEEASGRDSTATASTDIGHIGKITVELSSPLFTQGHRPATVLG